jgi:transcriptional regulator with XRE-family HTH domain
MPEQPLRETLRNTRLKQQLSQTELARKLGIRQSQISALERNKSEPRLSTLQDVARILDLELMLVPRQFVPVIESLLRRTVASPTEGDRPMYTLEHDSADE